MTPHETRVLVGGLILTHLLSVLLGVLIGSMINWEPVRRNRTPFRYMLAGILLLAITTAVILATRA